MFNNQCSMLFRQAGRQCHTLQNLQFEYWILSIEHWIFFLPYSMSYTAVKLKAGCCSQHNRKTLRYKMPYSPLLQGIFGYDYKTNCFLLQFWIGKILTSYVFRNTRPPVLPVCLPLLAVICPFTTTYSIPVEYWWGATKVLLSIIFWGSKIAMSAK